MELNDEWVGTEGKMDNGPFLLRYRPNLANFFETGKYSTKLDIIWNYSSDNDALMPTDKEMSLMGDVEDTLISVLEADFNSILTFVFTGDNHRVWYWYSSDINITGKRINEALSRFDKLPIRLQSAKDPGWLEYFETLESIEDDE